MSDINLTEVQVQRLNLQPGEILIVKIRSDELTQHSMSSLREGLMAYFPNNKIIVLGVGENGGIDLTVAQVAAYDEPKPKVDCSTVNYCDNCSCGKKEAYEGK